MTDFRSWFSTFTGCPSGPHPWQQELAEQGSCDNRLIRIPTGLGKTAGTVAAWAWNRIERNDAGWPRRLVFCLPMRVLVEQTHAEIRRWLERVNLLWDGSGEHGEKVGVHLLMGGASTDDWSLWPEHAAVLVGTQDMLLSRALNRGYAAPRARWPMELGLLNQDALWVMDEIQLMDVGLATSAQLQAFRQEDFVGRRELRPCRTWWMSATLQPSWLRSVDTEPMLKDLLPVVAVPASKRSGALWSVRKSCSVEAARETGGIAEITADRHQPGSLTLVVVNKVETAREVHSALKGLLEDKGVDLRLVHSRFRLAERASWRDEFLNRASLVPAAGRIVVATQVVEAGVDISAKTLVTELAPWSSLVQRFGRCARYEGESGVAIVIDRGWGEKDAKAALPYELAQLAQARMAVAGLDDVSPASLDDFEASLTDERRAALYPYEPRHLLLRREWEELFDTSPDLSGADLDISRFIRTGEEMDCLVFWRSVPEGRPPQDWQADRVELCPVSFLKARDWLCGEETASKKAPKLKEKIRAWVWDWVDGEWRKASRRTDVTPGRIVLVDSSCGGYETAVGWSPDSRAFVSPVQAGKISPQEVADGADEQERLSEADAWKTIVTHGEEAARLASEISDMLVPSYRPLLEHAGLWHDVGKAHPCFQGSMRHEHRPGRQDLAKAPSSAWKQQNLYRSDSEPSEHRPGLRHELASVLAMFAAVCDSEPKHAALSPQPADLFGDGVVAVASQTSPRAWVARLLDLDDAAFNLVAYLVASHHGKVRMSLQAGPKDQDYRDEDGRGMPIRGVREGDQVPSVTGPGNDVLVPGTVLTLEPAHLGLSDRTGPSWAERTLTLLRTHGPGALAFLEAIMRAADIRASRLTSKDPLLQEASR